MPLGPKICKTQNKDGGWGKGKSNAYETAISILALTNTPVVEAEASIRKGISFLGKQQQSNGSWSASVIWRCYYVFNQKAIEWAAVDINSIITSSLSLVAICPGRVTSG